MKKVVKQVIIADMKSEGNSFGDRIFTVTVEYREDSSVVETKIFEETAFEGEHSDRKKLITMDIKTWAKTKGTYFTGWV